MIERVSGKLIRNGGTFAVIDCGGVGYKLNVSARTGSELPSEGEALTLLSFLHVREGIMQLYGFLHESEREVFLALIGISGIGPRLGQRILSEIAPLDLMALIATENRVGLTKIKGIGKKTAELLVLGLKDLALSTSAETDLKISGPMHDAMLALVSLGVRENKAQKALEKAVKELGSDASLAQLIPTALKHT